MEKYRVIIILVIMVIIFLFFVFFILFKITPNNVKGKKGENKVAKILRKYVNDDKYLINNLIIPTNTSAKSTQIDHILLTTKGIFLIETKNYGGLIKGNIKDREWVQTFSYSKKQYSFQNPITQNKQHIIAFLRHFKIEKRIIGLVVFVQNNLGTLVSYDAVNLNMLSKYLEAYPDDDHLSYAELDAIVSIINKHKINQIKDEEHVQNLKNVDNKIKEGICPRCGNKLVKRSGKYGDFMGCSNYPKCRYTTKQRR